jgi:putative toxin-antitoxin system antitoxin component (TIGR02293 family)
MTSAALSYLGLSGRARRADPLQVDTAIRRGFPASALLGLKKATGFTSDEIATLLDVSPKTLERAISKGARLGHGVSDRLYRVANVLALAKQVLEDQELARDWMHEAQHGLGGRTPVDLLATEAGSREVENLLGRIEHGFLA